MLLLRLSPLIPYNVFNYVIAATAVSLRHYTLALPAMVPATVGYVYVGASIFEALSTTSASANDEGSSAARTVQTVFLVVGAVASVAAIAAISWVAKRQLSKLERRAAACGAPTCVACVPGGSTQLVGASEPSGGGSEGAQL